MKKFISITLICCTILICLSFSVVGVTKSGLVFGDVNNDGECTTLDLIRLKKYLAGQTVEIPDIYKEMENPLEEATHVTLGNKDYIISETVTKTLSGYTDGNGKHIIDLRNVAFSYLVASPIQGGDRESVDVYGYRIFESVYKESFAVDFNLTTENKYSEYISVLTLTPKKLSGNIYSVTYFYLQSKNSGTEAIRIPITDPIIVTVYADVGTDFLDSDDDGIEEQILTVKKYIYTINPDYIICYK